MYQWTFIPYKQTVLMYGLQISDF